MYVPVPLISFSFPHSSLTSSATAIILRASGALEEHGRRSLSNDERPIATPGPPVHGPLLRSTDDRPQCNKSAPRRREMPSKHAQLDLSLLTPLHDLLHKQSVSREAIDKDNRRTSMTMSACLVSGITCRRRDSSLNQSTDATSIPHADCDPTRVDLYHAGVAYSETRPGQKHALY